MNLKSEKIISPPYERYTTKRFPRLNRDLPIVAPDHCYTMDIMFFTTILRESTEDKKSYKRRAQAESIKVVDNSGFLLDGRYRPDYESALILVETTSRKAFAYPMHGKNAKEVLVCFKKFLTDVGMKIARLTSDKGQEYSLVKEFINKFKICEYLQVNSSQNQHTTLSRVDRFIRTLRNMIMQYYNSTDNANWFEVLQLLITAYNNSLHSSLFLRGLDKKKKKLRRFYYSPKQVYSNPELRRRIKIKDYLAKHKNYSIISGPDYWLGKEVYYRVLAGTMKYKTHAGFVSQYPAKIISRIGNSFRIQLKNNEDRAADLKEQNTSHYSGKTILVPFRDIIPATPANRTLKSKYKIGDLIKKLNADAKQQQVIQKVEAKPEGDQRNPPSVDDIDDAVVDYTPHRSSAPIINNSPALNIPPRPLNKKQQRILKSLEVRDNWKPKENKRAIKPNPKYKD